MSSKHSPIIRERNPITGQWDEVSKTKNASSILVRDSKTGRIIKTSPKSKRILKASSHVHREALERLAKR